MARGANFSASVEQWLEKHYTRFEDCSYYSLEVMRDLKRKFGPRAKLPLFSDPITYAEPDIELTYAVRPSEGRGYDSRTSIFSL